MGSYHARVIKENLTNKDKDSIQQCELTNMWGSEDLSERLIHFFETGKDYDPFKEKVLGHLLKLS